MIHHHIAAAYLFIPFLFIYILNVIVLVVDLTQQTQTDSEIVESKNCKRIVEITRHRELVTHTQYFAALP